MKQIIINCACGCGKQIQRINPYGYVRKFARGHGVKNIPHPWMAERRGKNLFLKKTNAIKIRATRWRAVKLVKADRCGLAIIGGCKGRFEINHIDKNPFNNALNNLIPLCQTHHKLTDNGRINLIKPSMPKFYVDGSGKRRYTKELKP